MAVSEIRMLVAAEQRNVRGNLKMILEAAGYELARNSNLDTGAFNVAIAAEKLKASRTDSPNSSDPDQNSCRWAAI